MSVPEKTTGHSRRAPGTAEAPRRATRGEEDAAGLYSRSCEVSLRPADVWEGGRPGRAIAVGGDAFAVIAGPCALVSQDEFLSVARAVKSAGAIALRGGLFKMRTRSEAFQGLGTEGYAMVREVRERTGMAVISEVTDPRRIEEMGEFVDAYQVGARSMHHYELLKELGRQGKPVLLKRGLSAYLDEWLAAADYVAGEGRAPVIFCERGIRTFERATRNTLDLSAVPYVKQRSPFPIVVDPSHATGSSALVAPMCLAAAAAGADGLLVEVHPDPPSSVSDGSQAMDLDGFRVMMAGLRRVLAALGRPLRTLIPRDDA